jgi:hypothetical protein
MFNNYVEITEPYPSVEAQNAARTEREFQDVKSNYTTELQISRIPPVADCLWSLIDYTKLFNMSFPDDSDGKIVRRAFMDFFKTFKEPGNDIYTKTITFDNLLVGFIEDFVQRVFHSYFVHGMGISFDYRNEKNGIKFSERIINPPDYKFKMKDSLFGSEVEYKDGWITGMERTSYAGKLGVGFTEIEFLPIKNLNIVAHRPGADVASGTSICSVIAKQVALGEDILTSIANAIRLSGPGILIHEMRNPPLPKSKEWDIEQKNLNDIVSNRMKAITMGENENYRWAVNFALSQIGNLSEPHFDYALKAFKRNPLLWGEKHNLPRTSLLTVAAMEERTLGYSCRRIRNHFLCGKIFPKALKWYLEPEDYERITNKQNDDPTWKAYTINELLIVPPDPASTGMFITSTKGSDVLSIDEQRSIISSELQISLKKNNKNENLQGVSKQGI